MKSVLSLTLIICLAGSTLPVAAQDRFEPMSGPMARAVTFESSRLAAAQPKEPPDRDWSRVRALEPGTEVMVTVKGSRPVRSPFVRADESGLWVKTFDRDRTLMSIARVDVVEIRQVNKLGHPARKGALIGLAAGSVIPLIVGVNCSGPECASAVGSTFAFYGGIGAAVGALIGAVAHKTEKMIYRAP